MKNNLFYELKQVVMYYSNLRSLKEMGFSISLSNIEKRNINNKVKRIIRSK